MVLFKRKTVTIPPPKYTPEHADQHVWYIPETQEYFCTYDDYLARMDFYTKKKFICELSGASCLTFFDARRRELQETDNVLRRFPEPLKRPILAKVHLSTTTRLDQLVDELYGWLRNRYFVGEFVTVRYEDQRLRAEVIKAENGVYQVDDGKRILEGDGSQLIRDRKVVSKLTLRAFIKHSASREQWLGAPWIVREDYVAKFNLPTEIPPEVARLYKQRLEENEKAQSVSAPASARKSAGLEDEDFEDDSNAEDLDDDESGPSAFATGKITSQRLSRKRIIKMLEALPDLQHMNQDDLFVLARLAADEPLPMFVDARIKSNPWPAWHRDERLQPLETVGKVGHLLEVWLFSQLFNEFIGLEAENMLSFDAFVDALSLPSLPRPVVALHEALLNQFVPAGERSLAISLPTQVSDEPPKRKRKGRRPTKRLKSELHDEDEDVEMEDADHDADHDGDEEHDEEDDGEKGEGDDESEYDSDSEAGEKESETGSETWVDKIAQRQYADGGWQLIFAEILADLCFLRDWEAETRPVVDILTPPGETHTAISVAGAYAELSLVHKVHALMMVTRVIYASTAFREYLDSQYESLNKLKKLPLTRELKQLKDDHKNLERVIRLIKDGMSPSDAAVKIEPKTEHKNEIKAEPKLGSNDHHNDDDNGHSGEQQPGPKDEVEDSSAPDAGERGSDKAKRSVKADDETLDLVTLEENEARLREQIDEKSREVNKVAVSIARFDDQRMRLLGEDRFFNRYWWFDGNGVTSSLSDTKFAMGRICVQGPTLEKLENCLNSQQYADEFVQYRKVIFQQALAFKQRHKRQLRLRREARSEQDRKTPKAASVNATPGLSQLPPLAPKPPQQPKSSGTPKPLDLASVRGRIRTLLEIRNSPSGLNEQQIIELKQLQNNALNSGTLGTGTDTGGFVSSVRPGSTTAAASTDPSRALAKEPGVAGTPGFDEQQLQLQHQQQPLQQQEQGQEPPASNLASTVAAVPPSNGEQQQQQPQHQPQQLTDQQLRLKQAQDQVQMRAQIAARIQAHFDAEVRAQTDACAQQQSPQPPQPVQAYAPPLPAQPVPPQSAPAQSVPPQSVPPQPVPPQLVPQGAYPPPQQQPYPVYPVQDQVQWVIQQTAYGPMLYAVPVQQYQLLMQQYGLQGSVPPSQASATDAYQAYLQQLAMQQVYLPQGYNYPPGYPQVVGQEGPQQMQGTPLPEQQSQLMQPQVLPQPPIAQPPQPPAPVPPPAVAQAQSLVPSQPTNLDNLQEVQYHSTPEKEKTKSTYLSQVMNSDEPPAHPSDGNSGAAAPSALAADATTPATTGVGNGNTLDHAQEEPSTPAAQAPDQFSQQANKQAGGKVEEPIKNSVGNPETIPPLDAAGPAGSQSVPVKENASGDIGANEHESTGNGQMKAEHLLETDPNQVKIDTPRARTPKRKADGKESTGEAHDVSAGDSKDSPDAPAFQEPVLTPLELLDLFENKCAIVSPNEWRFYETPEEIDQLISYLLEVGSRENKLVEALRKAEKDIKRSMTLRLESLGRIENSTVEE